MGEIFFNADLADRADLRGSEDLYFLGQDTFSDPRESARSAKSAFKESAYASPTPSNHILANLPSQT